MTRSPSGSRAFRDEQAGKAELRVDPRRHDRSLRAAASCARSSGSATSSSCGCGSSCWRSRPSPNPGVVPEADYERIRREVGEVDPERAREIERESQHDVIAFLRSITEGLGPEGRWLHYGLTSSDVLDTATAVVLRDATGVVGRRAGPAGRGGPPPGDPASRDGDGRTLAMASTRSRSRSASRPPAGSPSSSATRSAWPGRARP